MRKSTVVKLFMGSLVGMAASLVLFIVVGALALRGDVFVMDGPDVVGVNGGVFGWTMLGLAVVAALGMLAALAAQLVAWVGAVLNTARIPDKTWFIIVLVGGLVSLGFLATLAYVIGGPDGEPPLAGALQHPLESGTTVSAPEPHGQRTPALVHHG